VSAEGETARDAAERVAKAVKDGNIALLMGEITPEALMQMMQMQAAAGGVTPAQMPNIESYNIEEMGPDGDAEVFHLSFTSSIGNATLAASWKQILGKWKISAVSLVSAEAAPGAELP
jgi:hypothetical protein